MKSLGKTIVLIMLIIIMALGGLLWFNYLGFIRMNSIFAPVYKLMGKDPQTSMTATSSKPITADLDQDRINKQIEALDIRREEYDRREEEIIKKEQLNDQIAAELASREKSQEELITTVRRPVELYVEIIEIEGIIPKILRGLQQEVHIRSACRHQQRGLVFGDRAFNCSLCSKQSYTRSSMPSTPVTRLTCNVEYGR